MISSPGRASVTSVRALSEALGISRTPVREALVDLAKEGLVSFERSRGVRVNDSKGHDILEIFQLRRMVEIPAMREAVLRFTVRDVRALGRELAAMRANLEDERTFMHHDRAFHRVPLEVLGNARLIAVVDSLRDQTRVRGLSTVGRTRDLRAIVAEHQAIYQAARDGSAARAAQRQRKASDAGGPARQKSKRSTRPALATRSSPLFLASGFPAQKSSPRSSAQSPLAPPLRRSLAEGRAVRLRPTTSARSRFRSLSCDIRRSRDRRSRSASAPRRWARERRSRQ